MKWSQKCKILFHEQGKARRGDEEFSIEFSCRNLSLCSRINQSSIFIIETSIILNKCLRWMSDDIMLDDWFDSPRTTYRTIQWFSFWLLFLFYSETNNSMCFFGDVFSYNLLRFLFFLSRVATWVAVLVAATTIFLSCLRFHYMISFWIFFFFFSCV